MLKWLVILGAALSCCHAGQALGVEVAFWMHLHQSQILNLRSDQSSLDHLEKKKREVVKYSWICFAHIKIGI